MPIQSLLRRDPLFYPRVPDVPREGTSVTKKPVFMLDVPVFGTSVMVGTEIRPGSRSYFPTLGAHRLPLRESAVPPSTTSGTNRPYPQIDHPREPPEIVYSGGDSPNPEDTLTYPQIHPILRIDLRKTGTYPHLRPVLRISGRKTTFRAQKGAILRTGTVFFKLQPMAARDYLILAL